VIIYLGSSESLQRSQSGTIFFRMTSGMFEGHLSFAGNVLILGIMVVE